MEVSSISVRHIMERSAEITNLTRNNANGIHREMKVKRQTFGIVPSFKLGAIVSNDGPIPEILSRTAQASAALTKLTSIWRDKGKTDALLCYIYILYACVL